MAFRIVSYNIRFGGGRRLGLLAQVIASLGPDLVVLQEAGRPAAVETIARLAGMPHVLCQPGWSVAALSREPVRAHRWHRATGMRGFLELEPASMDLRVVGVHLPAGLSRRGERGRMRHLDVLLPLVGGAADGRTLIVGDLNTVGQGDQPRVAAMPFWLRILLRFDGGIRTDVLDRLVAAGWVDVFRDRDPAGAGYTLPAGAPGVRLDYVLAPPAILPRVLACAPVSDGPLVARASDHLPLLLVLDAPGDGVGNR